MAKNTPSFLIGGSAQGNNLGKAVENQIVPVTGQLRVDDADGMSNPGFKILGAPENGTATLDAEGNWTYVPHPDFSGWDKFLVVVTDDVGHKSSHFVQVHVDGGADAGIDAFNDTASTSIGATVTIDVLANDTFTAAAEVTHINGQSLENGAVTLKDAAGNVVGTVTLNAEGKLDFKASNVKGEVTFSYTATNSYGVSEDASVTVAVDGKNPPAFVTGDSNKGAGYADESGWGTATGYLTVGDVNGIDAPNFQIFAQGNDESINSVATIDSVTGFWTYTAPVGSKETFIVKVTDNLGAVSSVGVTGEILPAVEVREIDQYLTEDAATEVAATGAIEFAAPAVFVAPLEEATAYVA